MLKKMQKKDSQCQNFRKDEEKKVNYRKDVEKKIVNDRKEDNFKQMYSN